MKSVKIILLALACISLLLMAYAQQKSDPAEGGQYVCPMECKKESYKEPGNCPVCGMSLVKKSELKRNKHVAILLFEGVQIIDYSAPWEVFGQAGFKVYSVAEKSGPLTTSMGMSVNPNYTFEDVPVPDILMVPGGGIDSALNSTKTMEWIKATAKDAEYVMSVCNGAFLLSKAGLLDGLSATTFYGLLPEFKNAAQKTKVVTDQRFVDNGKVITSAGLTSGMDAALHLVSKIKGKGSAQALALHLEYNWQPDLNWARAALADLRFSALRPPDGYAVKVDQTSGNRNEWQVVWNVEASQKTTAAELEKEIAERFHAADKKLNSNGETIVSSWTTKDNHGELWSGKSEIRVLSESPKQFEVRIDLKKAA